MPCLRNLLSGARHKKVPVGFCLKQRLVRCREQEGACRRIGSRTYLSGARHKNLPGGPRMPGSRTRMSGAGSKHRPLRGLAQEPACLDKIRTQIPSRPNHGINISSSEAGHTSTHFSNQEQVSWCRELDTSTSVLEHDTSTQCSGSGINTWLPGLWH